LLSLFNAKLKPVKEKYRTVKKYRILQYSQKNKGINRKYRTFGRTARKDSKSTTYKGAMEAASIEQLGYV